MESVQQTKRIHWSHQDRSAVAECARRLVLDGHEPEWSQKTILEAQRLIMPPQLQRPKGSISAQLVRDLHNLAETIAATKAKSRAEKHLTVEVVNELAKEWQKAAHDGLSTRNIKTIYYNTNMEAMQINSSKHANIAVERAVGHMQVDDYGAAICEVFDAMDGTLHAVLVNKVRGMEIEYKRDVVKGK